VAEANMNDLRSSIRNRDEGWQDDNVMIGFDIYKQCRRMEKLIDELAKGHKMEKIFREVK
jgi:hypothetical protein